MAYSMIFVLIGLYLAVAAALLNVSCHVSALEPARPSQTQESKQLSLEEVKKQGDRHPHPGKGHHSPRMGHRPPSKGHHPSPANKHHKGPPGKKHHRPSKGHHHPPGNKHHRSSQCEKASHKSHQPHCHSSHGGNSISGLEKSS